MCEGYCYNPYHYYNIIVEDYTPKTFPPPPEILRNSPPIEPKEPIKYESKQPYFQKEIPEYLYDYYKSLIEFYLELEPSLIKKIEGYDLAGCLEVIKNNL